MLRYIYFSLLLLSSLSTMAQKKSAGFLALSGNAFMYKDSDPIGAGTFTFSIKVADIIALGVGSSIMKFKGAQSLYTPVFGQLSVISKNSKAQGFLDLQVGYGFYNEQTNASVSTSSIRVKGKGGIYVSPGIGCYLRMSKSVSPFVKVAYANSSFSYETTTNSRNSTGNTSSKKTSDTRINGLVLSFGFRLG